MSVTEEEAKTKRCQEGFGPPLSDLPMTFPMGGGGGWPAHTSPVHCIGSACMAWRWLLFGHVSDTPRTLGDDRSRGYCGKAGKP